MCRWGFIGCTIRLSARFQHRHMARVLNSMKIETPNYTQIPNILLDRLFDFTHTEWKALSFVCRQTFGWHRKSHRISISFVSNGTGMSHETASNAMMTLSAKGVLTKELLANSPNQGYSYSVNLACDSLSEIPTTPTMLSEIPTTAIGNSDSKCGFAVGNSDTNKEIEDKEKNTKKSLECDFESFWKLYPRKQSKKAALAQYLKARRSHEAATIADGLKRHLTCDGWRNEGGKYIPYAERFLSKELFLDVPYQPKPTPPARDPWLHMGGNL